MSVYVGIDVHRNRSRVAVIDEGGKVLVNRNVTNGVKPVLSVIGSLPAGTPAAYEAAFGWGWLLELLEGHGFEPHMVHPLQCKAIASARLKNDKVDAMEVARDAAEQEREEEFALEMVAKGESIADLYPVGPKWRPAYEAWLKEHS